MQRFAHIIILLFIATLFVGCGSLADRSGAKSSYKSNGKAFSRQLGKNVVAQARQLVGTPYRYGGSSPKGFDCSGLVYYSFKKAGLNAPRTTSSLFSNTRRVSFRELRQGDLVFFKLTGRKVSHVGIYVGDDKFIHAPSSGKKVMFSKISNTYWRERYVGGGRLN